jgi:hypothetical protein
MYDNKPWYQSTGVVGSITGVISALVALIAALLSLKGIEISAGSQTLIVTLVVAFGGSLVGLIGRIKATQGIGKPLKLLELCAGESLASTTSFDSKLSELIDLVKIASAALVAPSRPLVTTAAESTPAPTQPAAPPATPGPGPVSPAPSAQASVPEQPQPQVPGGPNA